MKRQDLTHSRLLEVINYNPETGLFTRSWGKRVVGSDHPNGYIQIRVDYTRYLAHRLAWFYVYGEWPPIDIDHINRDRRDNRISNLRIATRKQNNANRMGKARSGFKGVVETKYGFRAAISIDNRFKNLGTYKTVEEAHAAYCRAAKELFGEYYCALQEKRT